MRPRRVLLAGLVVVAAVGVSARAALQQGSRVLRVGMPAPLEPRGLVEGNGYLSQVTHLVYASAVHPDRTGEHQPVLAEGWWWSADGRTLTVRLREARFQDGSAIRAGDLVDAIARFPAHGPYRDAKGAIDAMRPVDERTLEIHLWRPTDYLLDLLEVPLVRVRGGALVGSGPYEVVTSDPQRFVIDRVRDGPGYDRMEFLAFGGTDELWKRLLAREIDLVPLLSPAGFEALARYPWVRRWRSPTTRSWILRWAPEARHGDELTRALALGVDREHLGRLVGPSIEVLSARSPSSEAVAFDPEAARRLLGFVPGQAPRVKLVIGYPASVSEPALMMAILEADLARVGIQVVGRPLPPRSAGVDYGGEDLHLTLDRIEPAGRTRPSPRGEITLGRVVILSAGVDTVCGVVTGTGGPLRHAERLHPCEGIGGE